MKRLAILLLTLALCLSLCACGGKPKTETAAKAGGWTANSEGGTDFPEEAAEAFRDAIADYPGVGYVPMAYLGSQVVAGSNYAFLCRNTTLSVEPETTLTVVVVYKNLNGKSAVSRFEDVKLSDFSGEGAELTESMLAGGWRLNREYPGTLPDEARSAFDKAVKDADMDYMPLALLGTQVVSGRNYAVLCVASTKEETPRRGLCVAVIYEDTAGSATVTSVSPFEIP